MEIEVILIIVAIIVALIFEFINGFHDCANAIATVVGTKVLTFKQAVILASILNFVGALFIGGVAKMIAIGLINVILEPKLIIFALVSAIIWNLVTWVLGLPSSSSHALIGGLVGVTLAKYGIDAINLANVGLKVVLPLVLSPILGIGIGWLILKLSKKYLEHNKHINKLQILSASLMAFSHGSNDSQKTIGIIVMLLLAGNFVAVGVIPTWVIITCAIVMASGTLLGGRKIIETMGCKITELKPLEGFVAETSASIVIQLANMIGAPISTTHIISSSIIGVGLKNGVNWQIINNMVKAWVLTLPVCIVIGYALAKFC